MSERTLGILLESGAFSRVHHALAMAAAASAMGRPVVLFATNAGCAALTRAPLPDAWRADDAAVQARGVAGIEELLDACAALGVHLLVCEAGLRVADIAAARLRDDVTVAGIPTFLTQATGQIVSF